MNTSKSSLSRGSDGSGVETGLSVDDLLRKPTANCARVAVEPKYKALENLDCAV